MPFIQSVEETNLSGFPLVHRGKVRDVYQIGEQEFLLVATDRISAFDCVFPNPVPGKGRVLTALSKFWFARLENLTRHHLITDEIDDLPVSETERAQLRGRSMRVRKTKVFPVECVVRGYLAGSGWKDYQRTGAICGHRLPSGLVEAAKLRHPIFTPATKAETGHDQNIDEAEFEEIVGKDYAARLRSLSLNIYQAASEYARSCGIIIADTKFEFGLDNKGDILLIDEALTPDSSRFWAADSYQPGISPASFDKQFVRNYLETIDWNKEPPVPALPTDIISATSERYLKAYELLTGEILSVE